MARSFRSPAVLMTVYVALFICGGPWLGSGGTADRNVPQIAIAVLLAVLAARGSRMARGLMITFSVLGAFAEFVGITHWGASEPLAASSLVLTCILAQIGLLVSTPMYERTRPGWSPGQPQAAPFLPQPKVWAVLATTAGGLVMALVPFSDGLRGTICSAGGVRPVPCEAAGSGYPIAYRFPYNNLAPRGFHIAAFAADWVLWSLAIFLLLYLLQLSRSRENSDPAQRPAVDPVPAGP
jgi:hypothetical protein